MADVAHREEIFSVGRRCWSYVALHCVFYPGASLTPPSCFITCSSAHKGCVQFRSPLALDRQHYRDSGCFGVCWKCLQSGHHPRTRRCGGSCLPPSPQRVTKPCRPLLWCRCSCRLRCCPPLRPSPSPTGAPGSCSCGQYHRHSCARCDLLYSNGQSSINQRWTKIYYAWRT
jgi:hypothetical protein